MRKPIIWAIVSVLTLILVFTFLPTGASAGDIEAGYETTLSYATNSNSLYSKLAVDSYTKAVTASKTLSYDVVPMAFAFTFQSLGGSASSEMCKALTGNSTRPYFLSGEKTGDCIVSVEIPIWHLDESTGKKSAATTTIQVNKLVADDVVNIMTLIFNDPEQFPIKQIGGFRTGDHMRHAYGCAIDINPAENPYNGGGGQAGTVGNQKYLKDRSSPYCIQVDGSVVKAFAAYGWGWGGQHWVAGEYDKYIDMMHFSVQANGG